MEVCVVGLLSGLFWPSPVGVERALVDVAREMRCVRGAA
ncbi:hypothetical protein DB32_003210 [Sandaracinus amylolyticus]|uniref:Uncharacterized protein n=1 Tax=Sandaracinus amylolyticus TaxID=927083 RepID=A0A0F6W2Y8_9BACT|nr:hypothetical protein DB32_003210 [Sandaracinus amylolyticus]